MGIDARIRVMVPATDEKQINRWAYELAVCFDEVWHDAKDNKRALLIIEDEDLSIPDGHMLLEVSTLMRYYGVHYERGPLPTIIMIAKWLEIRTKGTVYYDGDNVDWLTPFDEQTRNELFNHYVETVGRLPYDNYFTHNKPIPPVCQFDQEPMISTFSGPYERYGYECPACNETVVIDLNPPHIQESYKSWVK